MLTQFPPENAELAFLSRSVLEPASSQLNESRVVGRIVLGNIDSDNLGNSASQRER